MVTVKNRNQVELCGTVEQPPIRSHENHGEVFFRFPLAVPRLSGQTDHLQVLVPEALAEQVLPDRPLQISGQLRAYNNKSGQGSRLVITVLAQELFPGGPEPQNRILLSGTLCKPPILRRTPLGRSICDLMLAVGRRYGRADYLPVIAWGRLASRAGTLGVGDRLSLEGRIQSRVYTKMTEEGPQERTAYEVSVMHLLDED